MSFTSTGILLQTVMYSCFFMVEVWEGFWGHCVTTGGWWKATCNLRWVACGRCTIFMDAQITLFPVTVNCTWNWLKVCVVVYETPFWRGTVWRQRSQTIVVGHGFNFRSFRKAFVYTAKGLWWIRNSFCMSLVNKWFHICGFIGKWRLHFLSMRVRESLQWLRPTVWKISWRIHRDIHECVSGSWQ